MLKVRRVGRTQECLTLTQADRQIMYFVLIAVKLPYRSAFTIINPKYLVLLVDKQSSHALSSTNTHTRQQDLLLCPPRLAQNRRDLSRAGRAQRVTQRDRTTSHVHFGVVESQHVDTVDGHGGKGLVDLKEINVVFGQVEFIQELGDGN